MASRRRDRSRSRSERGNGRQSSSRSEIRGVSLVVLDGMPVVNLEAESPLYEHASWMLQTALDASGKADGLYEYIEDDNLVRKCAHELRLDPEEMSLVRCKKAEYRDVIAIGTNGKRSIMLAVVVALLLKTKLLKSLWKELRSSGLSETFLALVQSGKRQRLSQIDVNRVRCEGRGGDREKRGGRGKEEEKEEKKEKKEKEEDDGGHWGGSNWGWQDRADGGGASSSSWKNKEWGTSWMSHDTRTKDDDDDDDDDVVEVKPGNTVLEGVELRYIRNNIPVVDLEPVSVFHENVSWLLQTAFDVSGKADGVFEYYDDDRVLAECKRKFGMSAQETGIARVKKKELHHILAVGTCGKRSSMLAILVAYAMHAEDHLEFMRNDVRKIDPKLGDAFDELIKRAAELTGVKLAWRSGGGRSGGAQWDARPSWGTSSKKVPKSADADDMDSQLADYFGDDI